MMILYSEENMLFVEPNRITKILEASGMKFGMEWLKIEISTR
jgi:hypothetical protein